MPLPFEELDYQQTELGELILRRRHPVGEPDLAIYEVKLAGRFLMSSLVTDSERELASRALAMVAGDSLRVLVGGLGLGYTAATALADPRVARVDVIERLAEVIAWHRSDLVPLAGTLTGDARCHLIHDDCFRRLRRAGDAPYDAVLIDIDDSPIHLLDDEHEGFYTVAGLTEAARSVASGGVFALWTSLPAEDEVTERLRAAFGEATVEECRFDNPLLDRPEVNAIYYARR